MFQIHLWWYMLVLTRKINLPYIILNFTHPHCSFVQEKWGRGVCKTCFYAITFTWILHEILQEKDLKSYSSANCLLNLAQRSSPKCRNRLNGGIESCPYRDDGFSHIIAPEALSLSFMSSTRLLSLPKWCRALQPDNVLFSKTSCTATAALYLWEQPTIYYPSPFLP